MIVIRHGKPEEATAIWAVRTQAIRDSCSSHYDAADIDAWTSAPMPEEFAQTIEETEFFVAEAHDEIVGFGFLDPTESKVEAVFVRPDYARRGVGRRLMIAIENAALDRGLACLRLASSLNAVSFYRSSGYEVRKPIKYEHPCGITLDCVSMEKVLEE
jgi:GNAT superfamily N-acetyltransferase